MATESRRRCCGARLHAVRGILEVGVVWHGGRQAHEADRLLWF